MSESGQSAPPAHGLSPAERARGRRLAVLSHPLAMTHRLVYTDQLPTLALVSLGASEAVVGFQRALEPLSQVFQLTTLRALRDLRKRPVLIAGHILAVVGGLPLIAFAYLAGVGNSLAVPLAMASLAVTALGIVVSQTVWFPLLRTYVEPHEIGKFFGTLRSGWHLILIAYFVVAQRWLTSHPGAFGALFAAGSLCGLLRVLLIVRLPEADSATERPSRVRAALAILRDEPLLRRYLYGVALCGSSRRAVVPFVIVLMRRVLGLSEADVILGTVATYVGGVASLYFWGRLCDRWGARPVFAISALAMACLYLALIPLAGATPNALVMATFFFLLSVFFSGFGVADTHVLFRLAAAHEPTGFLVVADVASNLAYGIAPLLVGATLDLLIASGGDPVTAYRIVFLGAALATLASLLPLRGFTQ